MHDPFICQQIRSASVYIIYGWIYTYEALGLQICGGPLQKPHRSIPISYTATYIAGLETFRDRPFKTETKTKTISVKTKTKIKTLPLKTKAKTKTT